MSRIHEALKRAEEQRLTPGDPQELADDSTSILELPEATFPADKPSSAVVGHAPLPHPAATEPLSWELLVDRCSLRPWKPDSGNLFLNGSGPNDVGSEQFRTLRSKLFHIRETKPIRTIMVGSAVPAEGKTFVSANLAQSLARLRNRHVLVIDGDLRRSHLHEMFGTTAEPGLSDYLRGEADEFSIIQRGPSENLMFIPSGPPCSNPAELLGGGGLKRLIDRMSPIFEWIVIDSPPVVAVSDAALIARVSDGIILVVHAARTSYELAQRARKEFKGFPILGAVLNRVEISATYKSYYYGNYGPVTPGKEGR